MTTNIRFNNPSDGVHCWRNRKPVLIQVLNDFNSHLLGTQEGYYSQLSELQSQLPRLAMSDAHRIWIQERMYPTIWFDPENIELCESGDFWLSETPFVPESKSFDSAFPRLCTWIKGRKKNDHFSFLFANLHLDHLLPGTREQQSRVFCETIQTINRENLPLIITGDFNEPPHQGSHKRILNFFQTLKDCWTQVHHQEEGSHHSFDGISRNNYRIDWILADRILTCKSIEMNKISINGIYPSDHFPIQANFTL